LMPDAVERRYWEGILDRTYRGAINTWDYQWTASLWRHGLLTATPNENLVENIGFGAHGTHTTTTSHALPKAKPLGGIRHPDDVVPAADADRYAFDHHFSGAAIRARRHPIGMLRWLGHRAKNRLRRG
jgi:hypothetical protein